MTVHDESTSAVVAADRRQQPTARALGFGFLGAPIAWLVHLAAASALVPVACEIDTVAVVHATTVATALLAVAGIVVARRNATTGGDGDGESGGAGASHVRLLSVGGFWLGILFLALILLEGLPVFALEPCG